MLTRCSLYTQPGTVLFLAGILLTGGTSLHADEAKPTVSLRLSKASAERREGDTLFRCEVFLDNDTGKDLNVRSNFSSALDGVELVVTSQEGKTLVQQPYTFHQAPFAPPGREFTLKQGTTEAALVFPVSELPVDAKEVKVRLVGTLPGSAYQHILSTETIKIKVQD